MQIQFFGAAGMVTGSCYLFTTSTHENILIDCGMFQGSDVSSFNYESLPFDPKALSAVLLTHAHLDHCGRLPLLIQGGYTGKIYMTPATKILMSIALIDAVKVANEHTDRQPLYSEADVEKTLQHCEVVGYEESFLCGTVRVMFRNAAHILGSASIEITDGTKTVLFSGDLGNPQQKLLQPKASIPHADIVIVESTYGDRLHPPVDAFTHVQSEIHAIEQSGGVLLLPAFALDRTQVVLHLLNHLKKDQKISETLPVFLDSPMGIRATAVYEESRMLWSDELQKHTDNPFSLPHLQMTQDAKESENILKVPAPKVIIAGNGMMNGGRIWHHLINYLPLMNTRLLIVGYQGQGTIGREILEGARDVHLYHETVPVHATVTTLEGLSAHADQAELCTWLEHIQGVQKIFLIHGEEEARQKLAETIKSRLKMPAIILPTKDSSHTI